MAAPSADRERPTHAGASPAWLAIADAALRGSDARFVLVGAAVAALSTGVIHVTGSMRPGAGLELLVRLPYGATVAFCGLAPGLALLLALERRLPVVRALRWTALAGSVLLATALASALQVVASVGLGYYDSRPGPWGWALVSSNLLNWITLAAVWREALWQHRAARAALHASELRDVALPGQVAEAELQLLQAQIEPHFLINTLANVRRLGRLDAAASRTMLADLLHYLEQTLPQLREPDSTLAREAEVARAYLSVHKIRMGERLEVEFAVPVELGATPVPPMMLLTLIENALKHGIAPLPEGGRIRVAAEPLAGAVRLSVADTGRGLVPGRGGGTGLANLRARLRTLHGAAAWLGLSTNEPRGVVASIVLPRA